MCTFFLGGGGGVSAARNQTPNGQRRARWRKAPPLGPSLATTHDLPPLDPEAPRASNPKQQASGGEGGGGCCSQSTYVVSFLSLSLACTLSLSPCLSPRFVSLSRLTPPDPESFEPKDSRRRGTYPDGEAKLVVQPDLITLDHLRQFRTREHPLRPNRRAWCSVWGLGFGV